MIFLKGGQVYLYLVTPYHSRSISPPLLLTSSFVLQYIIVVYLFAEQDILQPCYRLLNYLWDQKSLFAQTRPLVTYNCLWFVTLQSFKWCTEDNDRQRLINVQVPGLTEASELLLNCLSCMGCIEKMHTIIWQGRWSFWL